MDYRWKLLFRILRLLVWNQLSGNQAAKHYKESAMDIVEAIDTYMAD